MDIRHPMHRWAPLAGAARALGGLLLPLLVVALGTAVRPAAAADRQYDLTVIVFAGDPAQTQVAASYSRAVDHAAVQAGVKALASDLGVSIGGLSVEDSPLVQGAKELSTAVEFRAPGLVASGQPLPLAAVLRAFPGWQHARVAFVVGNGFAFAGPSDGTGVGDAVARLVGSGLSYEYDVEQGQQGTSTPAQLAPSGSAAARRVPSPREASPAMGRILLSGTLVAAAAVAAWIIFRLPRRRKGTRG